MQRKSSTEISDWRKMNNDDGSRTTDIGFVRSASKSTSGPFQTLVVLEFSSSTPRCTIEWILSKIQSPRNQGGGDLDACTVLSKEHEERILHITASTDRLLMAAELMELKKTYCNGSLREVSLLELERFKNTEDLDNFLTMAEKQRIIRHEIESIRASEVDQHVPGFPKLKLYKGEAIIPKLMKEDVVEKIFPLHDKEALKTLGKNWYQAVFSVQPLDDIHAYFGSTVAMYFSFLGFYTMALIPPAFIGIISSMSYDSVTTQMFFCCFNLVWATVFLEAWKRNCATLAYKWGTIKWERFQEARAAFYGPLDTNPITGRLEPTYPTLKRALKFYFVSVPVVLFCLSLAFLVMLGYFWLQHRANAFNATHKSYFSMVIRVCPSALYAVVIVLMNAVYRKLAKALNDWENHRLETSYENNLITKLILFDFANCFMSLFYVAFYLQDMTLLRSHLGTLLITQQILGQIQESVLPYLMYKRRKSVIQRHFSVSGDKEKAIETLIAHKNLSEEKRLQSEMESSGDEFMQQAAVESEKEECKGTLDDYLEMFLQFGYVFLFSSVFPSAAFCALLNNITEIRTDSFKMCKIFRRPFAVPTDSIGAWQIAFELMSVIAVITNCALIALSPSVQEYTQEWGSVAIILFFVLAEHLILFIKGTVAYLIPDAPEWVDNALARVDYESKQAWRKQRALEAKDLLRHRVTHSVGSTDTIHPSF